jgi:hypothetical protein
MPVKKKMRIDQFLCLHTECRKGRVGRKVTGTNIKLVHLKNKKAPGKKVPVLKAHCTRCDGYVYKFVGRSKVDALKQKYN